MQPTGSVLPSEKIIDFFALQIQQYDTAVRDYVNQIDRIMFSAFGVVLGATTVISAYIKYAVLLTVPLLGFVGLFWGLKVVTDLFASAAHKFALERQMAKIIAAQPRVNRVKLSFKPWDGAGGTLVRKSPSRVALQLFYIVGVLFTDVICFTLTWIHVPGLRWAVIVTIIVSLLLAAGATFCYMRALTVYEETLKRIGST